MQPTHLGKLLQQFLREDLLRQAEQGKNLDFYWYGRFCLKAALQDDDLPLLTQRTLEAFQDALSDHCQDHSLSLAQALARPDVDALIWETAESCVPHQTGVLQTLYYLYDDVFEAIYDDIGEYFISAPNELAECLLCYLKRELETFCAQLQQELQASAPS